MNAPEKLKEEDLVVSRSYYRALLQKNEELLAALQEIAEYDDRYTMENDAGYALRRMARQAITKIAGK